MDISDTKNENGSEPVLELQQPKPIKPLSLQGLFFAQFCYCALLRTKNRFLGRSIADK